MATRSLAATPSLLVSLTAVARFRARRARGGALAWGLGLGAMSGLIVAIYPSFSGDLAAVMESLPVKLREAFGIESYDTASAFLDGEMYSLLLPMAVALFGIRQVAHDLVAHEERAWLDVELATPLGRGALVLGTYVAALVGIAVVAVIAGAGAWLAALVFGVDLPLGDVCAGTLAVWLLAAGFCAVALALSAVTHRSAFVVGGAVAVLVTMYVVDLAGRLVDELDPLRAISPFERYGTPVASGISLTSITLMAATAAALVALAVWLFERHDVSG